MKNKSQIINNNYNDIINNFIQNSYYSKLYVETQDTQFRKLIESFAILQAYQKYDYDVNMNNMILSILYNSSNFTFMHTDVIKTNLICEENITIQKNTIYENNTLYTNKYDIHCINGSIINVQTIESNMQYYMRIIIKLNNKDVKNISFIGSTHIINNIFANYTTVNVNINNIYYSCSLNIANIYEYCFYNEFGNIFHINNINKINTNIITIDIPLTKYIQTSLNDIQINTILLENKLIYSNIIEIEPNINKYHINLPTEYDLLYIIEVKNDITILLPAKEHINGWYLTYENNNWFININCNEPMNCYIDMMCYTKNVYTNNLKPLEYMPCTIQYTYLIERLNLMYKNYIIKLIMLLNNTYTNDYKHIFELLKLYNNYNDLQYTLTARHLLTNRYVNNICVTISGLELTIQSNYNNAAFKWALNQELSNYKNIVKIIWSN